MARKINSVFLKRPAAALRSKGVRGLGLSDLEGIAIDQWKNLAKDPGRYVGAVLRNIDRLEKWKKPLD